MITQNGEKLSDTTLSQLKLFYVESGIRYYRDQHTDTNISAVNHIRMPSEYIFSQVNLDTLGVRVSSFVNFFGVKHNYWYFEFPDGDIDTLYVESKILSNKAGKRDVCHCTNPFTVVRYNGLDAIISNTLRADDGKNVYVLKKD